MDTVAPSPVSAAPMAGPAPVTGWPLSAAAIDRFPALAAIPADRPVVMGVVNVTPDSFSDGGRFLAADAAIAQGRRLLADGADILDIGGESTRPGAAPVPPAEEQRRILSVIEALAAEGAVVSVDTRYAETMAAALRAGAAIVNDVSGLTHDPAALPLVGEAGCPVVIMHMAGTPETMQRAPRYDDVVADVSDRLRRQAEAAMRAGLAASDIAIDPGIGFGKTVRHNTQLLAATGRLRALGHPVLIGVSRKSFIAKLSCQEPAEARLPGSLAAMLLAVERGAGIVRVHDVAESVQALRVMQAILAPGDGGASPD